MSEDMRSPRLVGYSWVVVLITAVAFFLGYFAVTKVFFNPVEPANVGIGSSEIGRDGR